MVIEGNDRKDFRWYQMRKPDITVGETTIGTIVDLPADNFGGNSGKVQKYRLRDQVVKESELAEAVV